MTELDRDPVYERRSHMRGEDSAQHMGATGWLCKCGYVNSLDAHNCEQCHKARNAGAQHHNYLSSKLDPRD